MLSGPEQKRTQLLDQNRTNCWNKTGFVLPIDFFLACALSGCLAGFAPAQDRALRKRNLSGVGSPSVEWLSQRLQVN